MHSVQSLGSHPPFIGSHKVTYIGIYIQCIHSHTYLHSHRCIHTFTYIVRHSFVFTLSRVSTYALPCSLNTLSHLTITSAGISRSPDPRTQLAILACTNIPQVTISIGPFLCVFMFCVLFVCLFYFFAGRNASPPGPNHPPPPAPRPHGAHGRARRGAAAARHRFMYHVICFGLWLPQY